MKRFTRFIICLGLICPAMAMADVIYVSGDQTGTWSADTVIVTAEVRVPTGQSLTILPGVEVLFQVYCKLVVDSAATLRAVGTAADSIRFDALLSDSSWHGIRFLSASDSCRLEYCYLTHSLASGEGDDNCGGAIYCSRSNPIILHNTISGNSSGAGGGIYCEASSPTISENAIIENSGGYGGGAIYCIDNSNPIIGHNIVSRNGCQARGSCGQGIYCSGGNPIISDNTISENGGGLYGSGGGIYCNEGNPIISGNTIYANWAHGGGGIADGAGSLIIGNTIYGNTGIWGGNGIACGDSSIIVGNIISENGFEHQHECVGGGISCGADCIIINNTISGNYAENVGGIESDSGTTVVNCILWGNQGLGGQIRGIEQVSYSDIEGGYPGTGNIDIDPLFVDPENGNFHLMSIFCGDSAESPCIDAGDLNILDSLLDCSWGRGGPRSDMGAYGGGDSVIVGIGGNDCQIPIRFGIFQNYPNPFNAQTTIQYSLPSRSFVTIDVFDILGRKIQTLAEGIKPAGKHQTIWVASDQSSGIYFYRIKANGNADTKKMILVK